MTCECFMLIVGFVALTYVVAVVVNVITTLVAKGLEWVWNHV